MAESVEVTGKTVQHAINDALEQLGVSSDDVLIEVLDEGESGGLLGIGRKPAKVRVSLAQEDQTDNEEDRRVGLPEDVDYYGDEEDDESSDEEGNDEEAEASEVTESPEEAEATAYVASILSGIGIHGRISSYRDDDTIYIDVAGEDCGAAIGRHGETLDALQYLATLVANKISQSRVRVILDIDEYRRRRESNLVDMADRMAEKVLSSGKPYRLKPMSPADRRIVHSSLQRFEGITTFSEGNDPRRRVVIAPEDEEA